MKPLLLAAASAALFTACAYDGYSYGPDDYGAGRYGDYRYGGGEWGRERGGRSFFSGPGASVLDPWLAETQEGRDVVSLGFDGDDDGRITEDTAHRANIWFRRYADEDRNMELTDQEIRIALVQAVRGGGADGGGYR